jgi:hypothetical protein
LRPRNISPVACDEADYLLPRSASVGQSPALRTKGHNHPLRHAGSALGRGVSVLPAGVSVDARPGALTGVTPGDAAAGAALATTFSA